MTTEYRDGTVADLEPGDGFSWVGDDPDSKYEREPAWKFVGGSQFVDPERNTFNDPPGTEIRIWPGYFNDKGTRGNFIENEGFDMGDLSAWTAREPEFDLEAFRAKVEEQLNATPETGAWDAARRCYQWVLDLLPPKPQPTLEDDLRTKLMEVENGPYSSYDPRCPGSRDRHQSSKTDS